MEKYRKLTQKAAMKVLLWVDKLLGGNLAEKEKELREKENVYTRIYKISHKEDLGPMWMNKDNLSMCLHTKEHCFGGACQVEDITEELERILIMISKPGEPI